MSPTSLQAPSTARALLGATLLAGSLALAACSGLSGPHDLPASGQTRSTSAGVAGPPQLPGGGRTVFPAYRLVGYCGAPGSAALGQLGIGDLSSAVSALERRGAAYADGRKVMPVMELIATIVQADPGRDGMYRDRSPDSLIQTYLDVARKRKALLLLNIQPGRSGLLPEVKAYAKWLRLPDVGVALDPEWEIGPYGVPMKVFGHTTGADLNTVARYLSGIVKANNLPQKVMVYHELNPIIVRRPEELKPQPGVAEVVSVDGIGAPVDKRKTWVKVMAHKPPGVYPGFKLFFHEDVQRGGVLMTPKQVLALRPTPEYVMYE